MSGHASSAWLRDAAPEALPILPRCIHDTPNAPTEVRIEFVLPKADDGPTLTTVEPGYSQVPSAVPSDLRSPELDMRFGTSAVQPTAVPEARVNEYEDSRTSKH